jgi:hypothetical protein
MLKTRLSLILFILAAMAVWRCDQKVFTGSVQCSECYQDKPGKYFLSVYLTFNDSIKEIPLKLCQGDIENNNNILGYDTARAGDEMPFMYIDDVSLDKDYSMVAEYRFTGKTLYVVDGTHPKARLVSGTCDADCYVVDNNTMDLEIVNEFLGQ